MKKTVNRTTARIGSFAGTNHSDNNGYKRITINKKKYYAHRLAWLFEKGTIPNGKEIDHVNRNKQDNRIINLRVVTSIENCRNKGLIKSNISGTTGVSLSGKKWRASIQVNYKSYELGCFTNKLEAIRARKQAELKLWIK